MFKKLNLHVIQQSYSARKTSVQYSGIATLDERSSCQQKAEFFGLRFQSYDPISSRNLQKFHLKNMIEIRRDF